MDQNVQMQELVKQLETLYDNRMTSSEEVKLPNDVENFLRNLSQQLPD
jgi:hypothetical protein